MALLSGFVHLAIAGFLYWLTESKAYKKCNETAKTILAFCFGLVAFYVFVAAALTLYGLVALFGGEGIIPLLLIACKVFAYVFSIKFAMFIYYSLAGTNIKIWGYVLFGILTVWAAWRAVNYIPTDIFLTILYIAAVPVGLYAVVKFKTA